MFKVKLSRRYGNKEAAKLKLLGITGSIGMGKTATALIFRSVGVPVHDSDKAVHKLYAGDAVGPIGQLFPTAVREGRVDREQLVEIVQSDKTALLRIEQIIHPLIAKDRINFIAAHCRAGAKIVALDVPLLFETEMEATVDVVITITAPKSLQRERVLARSGMTESKFALLMERQRPDLEKRIRSHYVIDTSYGFDWVQAEISGLLRTLAN